MTSASQEKFSMQEHMDIIDKKRFHIFEWNDLFTRTHSHNYIEMFYVLEGTMKHVLDDEPAILDKGKYAFIDLGSSHSYTSVGNKNLQVINCIFYPEFVDQTLVNCKGINEIIQSYYIRFKNILYIEKVGRTTFEDTDGEILQVLKKMLQEKEQKHVCYMEIVRSCLITIIIKSMRYITTEDCVNEYDETTNFVVEHINRNYLKHITLTDIAEKLHFSPSYLSTKFKNDTGFTFMQYLHRKRVEIACQHLANTDDNISEIAEKVGFNDIRGFNLIFKRYIGQTPSMFRKSIK